VALLGPTAAGKTEAAIRIALALGAEIVSVDSMQAYRGMDIGTAKPTEEERQGVPHHLIDIVDPSEELTVADYAARGREVIDGAATPLLITGGSGLHFRSLVDPMTFAPTDPDVRSGLESLSVDDLAARLLSVDPDAAGQVDLSNARRMVRALEIYELSGETPSVRAASAEAEDLRSYRPRFEFSGFVIDPEEELDARIERRLAGMVAAGLVEEVAGLWEFMGKTARRAVNYRQVGEYLEGRTTLQDALAEAERKTKRLARKQRTWFRRDPRLRRIPWDPDADAVTRRVLESL
jgi:tRNA dimethylallyltransferase